jgi:hypothetical protein
MTTINPKSTFKLHAEVIKKTIEGATYLFDPRKGHLHTLNATSEFIVNQMISGSNFANIVTALTQEFDIDTKTAYKDAKQFLQKLIRFDVILPQSN